MKAIIAFPCPTIGICGETMARRKCLLRLHASDECRGRYPCLRRGETSGLFSRGHWTFGHSPEAKYIDS
jgi:hypothetical protein